MSRINYKSAQSIRLELESLVSAIRSLENSIKTWHKFSESSGMTEEDLRTIQSGVIHSFEVAYEQCWKFMKRWLETNISPDIADGISRRELFRISAENRLIDDVGAWLDFHQARNLTAHTYNTGNAEQAFESGLLLPGHARMLLQRLQERND